MLKVLAVTQFVAKLPKGVVSWLVLRKEEVGLQKTLAELFGKVRGFETTQEQGSLCVFLSR